MILAFADDFAVAKYSEICSLCDEETENSEIMAGEEKEQSHGGNC